MNWLQPTLVALLLLTGMGVALLGSIKLPLAQRLNMDEGRVGGLLSLFGFGMGPTILIAGFLTDSVGPQVVLMSGSLVFAASLAALGLARSYGAALAAVLLFSAGWALQINVGNVLTPAAFRFEGASVASAFNLTNVFFGLGAFLTPLAIAYSLRTKSLSFTLYLLAGLALLPVLFALATNFPTLRKGPEGIGDLLATPIVWLCAMALFFYGPLEASLGGWATSYLVEQGVSEKSAPVWLSSFWLMYMLGRLTTALTLPEGQERLLILVLSAACIALMAYLAICRNRNLATALIPSAGLIFGPIFPTLISVLTEDIPDQLKGRAIGLFFAIGGIGWTIIPMLIGAYAKRTSIRRAFVIALGAALGLSVFALIIYLR
jgi:fucose permease